MSVSRQRSAWLWLPGLMFGLVVGTILAERAIEASRRGLTDKRNPFWFRGWFDYVTETRPKQPGETLVLVLGNSQAFGFECAPGRIYPSRLDGELERLGHKPVRVVNWALPGGAGPEFPILAVAAARLKPDVTLCVLHQENFKAEFAGHGGRVMPLDALFTDAHQLVSLSRVRDRVSPWYRATFLRPTLVARAYLAQAWHPLLYRERPLAELSRYPALKPYVQVNLWGEFNLPPAFAPKQGASGGGVELSPDLVREYFQLIGKLPARKIFFAAPVRGEGDTGYDRVAASMVDQARAAGLEADDWTHALPDECFLSYAHFNDKGQREMARLLGKRLTP
jgi:hypothetical protein